MGEFPTQTGVSGESYDPDPGGAVIDLGDAEAEGLLNALQSDTARRILRELHEAALPPAKVAERADTSVQNAHYHLDRLEAAGAVEVVGSAYSEKGREMDVYSPTADPLVLVSGPESRRDELVEDLSELLGAVGGLALASVAVQRFVEMVFYPGGPQAVDGGSLQYGIAPATNVAPPVGLGVFLAGLVLLGGWFVVNRR